MCDDPDPNTFSSYLVDKEHVFGLQDTSILPS